MNKYAFLKIKKKKKIVGVFVVRGIQFTVEPV